MDVDYFARSPVGRLVPVRVPDGDGWIDHWSYVPEPLPEQVELDQATYNVVSEAALALGRLDLGLQRLPDASLLVRPALRREAVSTSALEGTYAGVEEIIEAELDDSGPMSPSQLEVVNYLRAADLARRLLVERPISVNFLCDVQRVLLLGTRDDSWQTGQIRKSFVCIGPHAQCKLDESYFVPPPPGEELEAGLHAWEKWIHESHEMALPVAVALAHYQFETLHPFHNGNGRVGRLVAALQFVEQGVLRDPVLTLSTYLEPRKDQYIGLLRETSATGAFAPWVRFFCTAIVDQANEVLKQSEALVALRDEYVSRLRNARAGAAALQVVEAIIGQPIIDTRWVADLCGITIPGAHKVLKKLVDMQILTDLRSRGQRRLLVAPAVMDITARKATDRG